LFCFSLNRSINIEQGRSRSQIFDGAKKKIAKKGSIFFTIWAKNNFELGKKKYLVGQTPKLIHSRYNPDIEFDKMIEIYSERVKFLKE